MTTFFFIAIVAIVVFLYVAHARNQLGGQVPSAIAIAAIGNRIGSQGIILGAGGMLFLLWVLLSGGNILLTLTLTAVGALLLSFALIEMGNANFIFTTIQEDTAKAIMAGDALVRWIPNYPGHHLNDPTKAGNLHWHNPKLPDWEVVDHRTKVSGNADAAWNLDSYYDDRPFILRKLGLWYVGVPWYNRRVNKYILRWTVMRPNANDAGALIPLYREAETDFIYLRPFAYAFNIEPTRTSDNLTVRGIAQVTLRTTNPDRSLFRIANYLDILGAAITRRARDYLGARTYAQLRSETDQPQVAVPDTTSDVDQESFGPPIIALSKRLFDEPKDKKGRTKGTEGHLGQEILAADLLRFELTGKHAEEQDEAATAVYMAEQRGAAKRITADAEAYATLATGTASANVERAKAKAKAYGYALELQVMMNGGQAGVVLAYLRSIAAENAGKTVVWANNPFAVTFPDWTKALQEGGIKTADDAIAKIMALVENLAPNATPATSSESSETEGVNT